MALYLMMGTYTNDSAGPLIKGNSDRRAAMVTMIESVGGVFKDYHITRGEYDFCIIAEFEAYEKVAAIVLNAKASGTLKDSMVLEALDLGMIRKYSEDVDYTPPKSWVTCYNQNEETSAIGEIVSFYENKSVLKEYNFELLMRELCSFVGYIRCL